MYGRCACMKVLLVLVLLQPSALHGQGLRQRPQSMPNSLPGQTIIDPREQRLMRERAVAFVGPRSRLRGNLRRGCGGCHSCLFAADGAQLVEFYISGGLDTLPQPRLLLRVIAQPRHGNEVAAWAITNVKELSDTDRFNAYLADPLTYALALKKLDDGVAELRENRKRAEIITPHSRMRRRCGRPTAGACSHSAQA